MFPAKFTSSGCNRNQVARAQFFQYLTLGVLCSTLTACLPLPHFQHDAPLINGTIRRQGAPAANVKVSYAINRALDADCRGANQETRTNAEGQFRTKKVGKFMPFLVFGDRSDHWSLCFQFPDGSKAFWSDHGYWGGPSRQRLTCNFGKALVSNPLPPDVDGYESTKSCTVEEIEGN
jgi:hypothetical protein